MSTPSPPSSSSPASVHRNVGTMLPNDLIKWHEKMRARALTCAEAYERALELERRLPRSDRTGYRLHRVDGAGIETLGIEPDTHVVVGRHTQCDLSVESDTGLSLRHVLVRSSVLDDGLPVLSILDLDSRSGFELSDGSFQRAVVGSGPMVFRIGSTWFVALPIDDVHLDALPSPIVRHVDRGSYRVNPRHDDAIPSPRAPTSRITSIPWSVPIMSRSAAPESSAPENDRAVDPSMPFELHLMVEGHGATVRFSERDVEHGILVGRHDKCADSLLRAVLNRSAGISRVHALVIREHSGIRLYDVASTNGTSDGNQRRVRCTTLADQPGTETTIYLHTGREPIAVRWRIR